MTEDKNTDVESRAAASAATATVTLKFGTLYLRNSIVRKTARMKNLHILISTPEWAWNDLHA